MLQFSSCKTPFLLRLFYERHERCSVVCAGTSCIVHSSVLITELSPRVADSHDFLDIPAGAGLVFMTLILFGRRKKCDQGVRRPTTFPCPKLRDFFLLDIFHITTRKQSIDKLCSFGKRQHVFGHPYHPPFPTALFWPRFP